MENLNNNTTDVTYAKLWEEPVRVRVDEYSDRIEMIYKQSLSTTYTILQEWEPESRVFKIVFSCVDGKWNKSNRIYGKIIHSCEESYEFDN